MSMRRKNPRMPRPAGRLPKGMKVRLNGRKNVGRQLQEALLKLMSESARQTYRGRCYWENCQDGFRAAFRTCIIEIRILTRELD
jgi:hypothetical protein